MQDPKADQIHAAAVLFALRSVAIFEAAKAILFLLLGCGVVDLIHNSVDAIAAKIALILRTRAIDRTPVALRNRGAVGWNSTLDWTMIRTAVDRVISATGVIFAVASSELAERRRARYKHCHRSNDVKFSALRHLVSCKAPGAQWRRDERVTNIAITGAQERAANKPDGTAAMALDHRLG